MKRAVSTVLVLIFTLVTLAACSPSTPTIAKMGLGHITSIAKSTDMTVKDGNPVPPTAEVDTVIAAVGFDKDGKVVKVTIDTAQTKVPFDKDMKVAVQDLSAPGQTKVELGDKYGMAKVSSIKKEWYQQIAALENWMVGKTVDQIKAMKTKKVDDQHTSVPDIPELTSSVTISVADYIAAVEEAYKNAVDVTKGAVKLGLGHEISIASSVGYANVNGKETLPTAQVNTNLVAAAFDKDGKVVKTIIDTAQTKVPYSKDGKVTADKTAPVQTKKELGDKYGMVKASSIGKEWYQQIAALENWMVGKTADQIKSMKTKQRDAQHTSVPDVPELTSSVTISVAEFLSAASEAYQNAK